MSAPSIPICQPAATWADLLQDRWPPAHRDKAAWVKVVWVKVDSDRAAASDKAGLDKAADLDRDRA